MNCILKLIKLVSPPPQDARHAAEGEIYTKLNQKIDEFIQLADYEWNMAESDGRASGYLMDLINFLRSTFQVFTHLPVSLTNTHRRWSSKAVFIRHSCWLPSSVFSIHSFQIFCRKTNHFCIEKLSENVVFVCVCVCVCC